MKPMLARPVGLHEIEAYLTNDDWVAQQKLDGDRILIRVADGRVQALNREGRQRSNPVPRKVLDQFQAFTTLDGTWCFDGELLTDGTLWLFDLPEASGKVTPHDTFEFRHGVLERFIAGGQWPTAPCVRLLPVARTPEAKRSLLARLQANGAEGLMFRHREGRYRQGKRSDMMLKAKFTNTADVIVHEVRANGHNNCTYRLFRDGVLVPAGSCSLEARPDVKPGDVIEVRYLYASDDGLLYQPTMLRIRDDKSPSECTTDQLHYTDRTVVMPPYQYVTSPTFKRHVTRITDGRGQKKCLCGTAIVSNQMNVWLHGDTTTDGTDVDCMRCLRILRKERAA